MPEEENRWVIGKGWLSTDDNLLDGFTFDDVILALHHRREINAETAVDVLNDILSGRMEDMKFLFFKNLDQIIAEAKKGRE